MNIDGFKDPSFLAQDDATKQRVLSNYFASSTANDSEFASLDPARKERIKNNFISTSLGALTQSAQPQRPKPQSAWRVDPKEGEDYAEPKFNTTAVATTPELFKAAPDKVKAEAAAGVADKAISKKWEDKAGLIGKPLAAANEFLNKAGLAVETTFGSVANTLGDTFSGSLTPSASTISDSAKKVGITDETALKKLDTLSKGAEQNFTDEELIKVKKLSDPSRTSIVSSLMGEKSSYTPEAMQRYVDGLDKALGDKYDVGANIGEKGELIPVAKLKGAGDDGWMELKGDGIWQDLKTGVVATLPITAAQIAGGYAAGRAAKPLITAASSIPGVWGKVAGAVGTAAAFGVGAAAATPVGVAAKNAMNDGEFHTGDTMREAGKEMSDSLLFDAALGVGAGVYQGVKPLLPDLKTTTRWVADNTIRRYLDGNSPVIDKIMKKAGVTDADVAAYKGERGEFESYPGPQKAIDLTSRVGDVPVVGTVAKGIDAMVNPLKSDVLDEKRLTAWLASLGADKNGVMMRHVIEAMEEYPAFADSMNKYVSRRANSVKEELDKVYQGDMRPRPLEEARVDILSYDQEVKTNYQNMKEAWQKVFPEPIDLLEASGLAKAQNMLERSISRADVRTAESLDRVNYLLQSRDGDILDLFTLRRDLNALRDKPATYEAMQALKTGVEGIDRYLASRAAEIEGGEKIIKEAARANEEYAAYKEMQDTPLFKKIENGSLREEEFLAAVLKESGASDFGNWGDIVSKLSSSTRERLENAMLTETINRAYKTIGSGSSYIDWEAALKTLYSIDERALTTASAKENYQTLIKEAELFKTDKEIQTKAHGIHSGSTGSRLATSVGGAMEAWWVSRVFKRVMMYMPTFKTENMAFRGQLERFANSVDKITPIKALVQLSGEKGVPAYVKSDFETLAKELIAEKETLKAIAKKEMELAQIEASELKRSREEVDALFSQIKAGFDAIEEQAALFALRDRAKAANREGAFNFMVNKGVKSEEIAKKLRLKEEPKEQFPYYVDKEGNVYKNEPFDAMDAQKAAMAPKREEPIAPTPEARPEPTPALDKWSQQKKDSLYAVDDAEAIARVEPELKEIVEKLKAGTATEEEAAKYIEVMDGYALEINKLRKEAAAAKKAEEVTPAQQAKPEPIDREQAANALQMMAAEGKGAKETRNRYNTQDALIQKLRSGEELTAKEAETLRALQDNGAIAHYGEMYKDRAPKNTAFFDKLNAEEMTAREGDEAFGREAPQKVFKIEDYVKAAPKEEVEAEAKEISAIAGANTQATAAYETEKLIRQDVEEILHRQTNLTKPNRKEAMAAFRAAMEQKDKMRKEMGAKKTAEDMEQEYALEQELLASELKKEKEYAAAYDVVWSKIEKALDKAKKEIEGKSEKTLKDDMEMLRKNYDDGLEGMSSNLDSPRAKFLAENMFYSSAAKLIELNKKNPDIYTYSHLIGGSGLLGGMANGLEYDENGNITGVDEQKFLIGFLGGAFAGALISGKAGRGAMKTAIKKLAPLREAALEGNTLAAKLHDKWLNSYLSPVKWALDPTPVGGVYVPEITPSLPKGFYSKLESVAEEKLPNKFGVTAANAIFKKNGVKDEELERVDVAGVLDFLSEFAKDEKGNIRKADFLAVVRSNRSKFTEDDGGDAFREYTTGGGSNYKVILVNSREAKPFLSPHWDTDDNLMHIRTQDIVDDKGKTLLIEEIQSDLHQGGRVSGYLKGIIPKAPFAKTWQEYGIKRMIQEAVDGDYNRVAWTTGATQNARYDLAKTVDEIIYNEKSNVLVGKRGGEEIFYRSNIPPQELSTLIGKDPAQRLMDGEANSGGGRRISGEELSVGGDGMKGFYDKILPDFTRGYIKKYGATVEKTRLPNGDEVWSFEVTPKMREEILTKGQALYSTPHALGTGTLSGTLAASTGDDEQSMAERFAAGFVGGVGAHAVGAKALKELSPALYNSLLDTAHTFPKLANDRPELLAQIYKTAKTDKSTAGIFAGQKAIRADVARLDTAKAMLDKGANEAQVWRETGWFQDKDGQWKFEIDDIAAKIIKSDFGHGEVAKLGDVIDHPKLFENYPALKDMNVIFDATANYSAFGKDSIVWGASRKPESLLHEIQHAIQKDEGFARGGGLNSVTTKDMVVTLFNNYSDKAEVQKLKAEVLGNKNVTKEVALSLVTDISDKYLGGVAKLRYETYKRLHGEAEARNTVARAAMNKDERIASFPAETMDVKPSKTIVKKYHIPGGGNMVALDIASQQRLQEWHKDSTSHTKNEDGTPKVFYHGSIASFDEFKAQDVKNGAVSGQGFYFTDNAALASRYAKKEDSSIYPVYVNIKNPLFFNIQGSKTLITDEQKAVLAKYKEYKSLSKIKELTHGGLYGEVVFNNRNSAAVLKDLGFDGVVTKTEVVALEPTQIKSVHNRGTYDETKPNILYSATAATAGATAISTNDKDKK